MLHCCRHQHLPFANCLLNSWWHLKRYSASQPMYCGLSNNSSDTSLVTCIKYVHYQTSFEQYIHIHVHTPWCSYMTDCCTVWYSTEQSSYKGSYCSNPIACSQLKTSGIWHVHTLHHKSFITPVREEAVYPQGFFCQPSGWVWLMRRDVQ